MNALQFGCLADGSADPVESDWGTGKLLNDEAEASKMYKGPLGHALNNYRKEDTIDRVCLQLAVERCSKEGIRLNVPNGDDVGEKRPIYVLNWPLWLGNDAVVIPSSPPGATEQNYKSIESTGFQLLGLVSPNREQADTQGANLRLSQDVSGHYVLTRNGMTAVDYRFRVVRDDGSVGLSGSVASSANAGTIKTLIEEALGTGYTVELVRGTISGDLPSDKNLYFKISGTGKQLPVNIVCVEDTTTNPAPIGNIRIFADSAVVSFRRSAGLHYRVADLTIRGNNSGTSRNADFAMAAVTTQFTGHVVERIRVAFVDTVFGILRGSGVNGEQVRVLDVFCSEARRAFFTDAPQAYLQQFDGWYCNLDNTGVYLDFANAEAPGFGLNFGNMHGTFGTGNNLNGEGTVVRVRRGTGIVAVTGGRIEHAGTLFDYDAVSGIGLFNNLDVTFRSVEFDGVRGGSDRMFLHGQKFGTGGTGTQYGLFLDACRVACQIGLESAQADLFFTSDKEDQLRAAFTNTRFEGVRSLRFEEVRADFVRCYRNDFDAPGNLGRTLRLFEQTQGTPGARTQSLRTAWQDTPWVQTGARFNALKNSDLKGQEQSTGASADVPFGENGELGPWTLTAGPLGGTDVVFGKWGAFAEANVNPGPESFFLKLKFQQRLAQELGFLDFGLEGVKVVTYQALVRVTGKTKFSLVNSDTPTIVYDEVVLGAGGETDWTLVTLRAQATVQDPAPPVVSHAELQIVCAESSGSTVKVWWQQAWGGTTAPSQSGTYPLAAGLANAGYVRTPDGVTVQQKTYPWAVNALSIRAGDRFQLPLLDTLPKVGDAQPGDAANMGWKSPVAASAYDLQTGEVYWDDWQKAMMAFDSDAGWYSVSQPTRVLKDPVDNFTWITGTEQLVYYTVSSGRTIILDTTVAKIAPGTTVRIAWHPVGVSTGSISVNCGQTSAVSIPANSGRTFVFFVEGSTGRWLAC